MRVKVYQDDVLIGTMPLPPVPPEGHAIRFVLGRTPVVAVGPKWPCSPWAEVRITDLRIEWRTFNRGWSREAVLVVNPALGRGDIESLQGFIWEHPERAAMNHPPREYGR